MRKDSPFGAVRLGAVMVAGLGLGACAHTTARVPAESAAPPAGLPAASATDATDRTLNPFDPQPIADLKLYAHEHWKGGSPETELREFADHVRRLLKAQAFAAKRHAQGPSRVFHQKQQGCLIGSLALADQRGDDGQTARGLFARDSRRPYTVLARLSNGVGFAESDVQPDVRGIALKIFGVRDAATGEEKAVDFLMTNSPTPFGRDEQEFIEFMEAQVYRGNAGFAKFALGHAETARRILAASFPGKASVMDIQYWTGQPYLLDSSGPAMKLNLRPYREDLDAQGDGAWRLEHRLAPHYLSEELTRRMRRQSMRFALQMQLERDEASTPIEDGLHEWTEAVTPSIAVGNVVFGKQDITNPELAQMCEQARFSPGHFVTQHRPLGNLGRGRVLAYRASQIGRGAPAETVSEARVLDMLKKVSLGP